MAEKNEVVESAKSDGGSRTGTVLTRSSDENFLPQEKQEFSSRLVSLFAGMALAVFCGALVRNNYTDALQSL
jgi:hypothetical protein